jgi:IS605 OrfB family transposase
LNGARELPSFKNIGLPIKHYVDPSGKTTSANFKWLDGKGSFSRSFSLSWDNAIGRIPFMIAGKRTKSENGNISYGLDPQQIMILKQIQSGKFTMCTSNLMEYDGEFTFLLAYHFIPQQKQDLDPKRVLELAWNPEECDPKHLFTISLKQGLEREVDRRLNDYLDASAVVPQLFSLRAQRNKLLGCLRACGSRFARTPEQGSPPSREHFSKRLDALSERRNNFVKHWNHRWTAQVIQIAIQWNCGTIMVMNLPSCKPKNQPQTSPETIGIINQAWQWSDFKFKLDYKAQEKGIQTSYVDDDSAGEQVKAIA